MEKPDAIDLYTSYLICNPRMATATGLSDVLDNQMKHDYISDALGQSGLDSQLFWKKVKPFVRKIEQEDSVLSIDDVIVEKPHSAENNIICYHYDHTKGRSVKGMNIVNFMLTSHMDGQHVNCPVGYHIVEKPIKYLDGKTGKQKRKSEQTKNEIVLEVLHRLVKLNHVKFKHILFDVWFAASPTLSYIHRKLRKRFVCPLKSNRLVALSKKDKLSGNFVTVSGISLENGTAQQVWVKGLDFPVTLTKQVFVNKDRSTAEQWLITNDAELDADQISKIYQKRWKIEEMHKSLKQNTLLAKSPTKMEVSQSNHVFTSMLAFVKLEKLKVKERLNHFAIKAKLHLKMVKVAMEQVNDWSIA